MSDVTVSDNPHRSRFEAHVGGNLAGFAEYELREDRIVFTHTEVDPPLEGRGVGGSLARGALDQVRARGGLTVVPECPFIKGWIEKRPSYASLVAQTR